MTLQQLKVFGVAVLALSITACSDRMGEAERRMAEIRSGNAIPIQPLPEPVVIEDFTYSAGDQRSPFVAQSLESLQAQQSDASAVKPDVNRIKEPLEQYDLSELVYRGTVTAPDGTIYGLVQLPNGFTQEVRQGEYMGKSDGKILEITPTQINLQEIVPDARMGFVHKITSLVTPN